jgi:hypothetical protein
MLKMADSDEISFEVKTDPRMRDPVRFNRIRDLVDKEILHQAWGCRLWALERMDKITTDQRKAGDAYVNLTEAYKTAFYGSVSDMDDDEKEKLTWLKKRYKDVQGLLTHGDIKIRRAVDELCLEELAPICEADLKRVRAGLTRLEVFFNVKNKP